MKSRFILQLYLWLGYLLAVPLSFHSAPGSTVTKQFTHEWKISLDSLTVCLDGRDLMDVFWPGFFMETELSQHVVVTDTYRNTQFGRPHALDRDFGCCTQELDIILGSDEWLVDWGRHHGLVGRSDLEFSTVHFRLVDGAYTKAFEREDDPLGKEVLGGLTEDMDLRMLVPGDAVAVGDSWDIDLATLPDLFSPGGYFAWDLDLNGEALLVREMLDPTLMGDLRAVLAGSLEGEATVTYASESNGRALLELEIDILARSDAYDLTVLVAKILGDESSWWSLDLEYLEIQLELAATGTALWDTRAGHIDSLELGGEVSSRMEFVLFVGIDHSLRVEVATELSAEFEQHIDVLQAD